MKEIKDIIDFRLRDYEKLKQTNYASPRIIWGVQEVKIVNSSYPDNNYPILCDNGERFSLNGKHLGNGQRLKIYYTKKPIIIDERLVSSMTFAVRFRNFLESIRPGDPSDEEELEYFKSVADELLDLQIKTVTDKEEKKYLKRLRLV